MLQFAIPCLLGLESLVGNEIKKLGLSDVVVENGRILCKGTEADIARLNVNLRCGARVIVVLGAFRAVSFEELFQGTRTIAWETRSKNWGFPTWSSKTGAFCARVLRLTSRGSTSTCAAVRA